MDKKENKELRNSLGTGIAMAGITAGLGAILLGGMNKMFGNTSDVPKGTVKEMMHGLMLGVVDLINEKDFEIKELQQKVQRKEELIEATEKELNESERKYEEVFKLFQDAKKQEQELQKKTKNKPGPKPKQKK